MSSNVLRLYFRRFAPFKSFGGGFEGDDRRHSTSLDKTSRTSARVTFTRSGVVGAHGHSSGSEWVVGSKKVGKVTVKIGFKLASGGAVAFTASSAGNNPLVPGSPDIDTYVSCGAVFKSGELSIRGTVNGDGFPNAEIFLRDWKGTAHMLMEYSTGSGWAGPLHRLFGGSSDNNIGKFEAKIALNADGSLGKLTSRAPYKYTKDSGAITFEPVRIPSIKEIMDPRSWGL